MNWPPRWKSNMIPLLIAIAAELVGVFVGNLLAPFTCFISVWVCPLGFGALTYWLLGGNSFDNKNSYVWRRPIGNNLDALFPRISGL